MNLKSKIIRNDEVYFISIFISCSFAFLCMFCLFEALC